MTRKGKGKIYTTSTKRFVNDAVAFETLMDFQYGTGKKFEKAKSSLLDETCGIFCNDINELGTILPKLDVLLKENEKHQKRVKHLLYVNDNKASLYGAKLLRDFGYEFITAKTNASHMRVYDYNSPLPVLIRDNGAKERSLKGVKNFIRQTSIPRHKGHKTGYRPYYIDFRNNTFYQDKNGELKHIDVWYFDKNNKAVFKGPIDEAPYPVTEMLKASWYVKRCGLKAFFEVVVWNCGLMRDVKKRVNQHGHVVQKKPPVVLFVDEIKALEDGKKTLIVDDHGCPYCVSYDAYFLKKDYLYRIYGYMQD